MKTSGVYENSSMEEILNNINLGCSSCEVLYNLGGQEVVKRDGKYYLESYPSSSVSKEITREAANELWNVYTLGKKQDSNNIYE